MKIREVTYMIFVVVSHKKTINPLNLLLREEF